MRRRRVSRLLDEVLRELYPDAFTPPPPSDFGLSPDDLMREANRLHRAGWTVHEITAVLAVPEPAA